MNSSLIKLQEELIGIREQTISLTKQMWLLYITFEDFVCIHYPERSVDLISSALQIDAYLSHPVKPNSDQHGAAFRFESKQSIVVDKRRSSARSEYPRSKDKVIDKNVGIDWCYISNSIEKIPRIGTENKQIRKTVNENCNHRSSSLVSRRSGSMAGEHRGGVTNTGGWNQCGDCRGHIVGNNGCAYFCAGLRCQERADEVKSSNLQHNAVCQDEQSTSCLESAAEVSVDLEQTTIENHDASNTESIDCETDNFSHCSQRVTRRSNVDVGKRRGLTKSFLLATYGLSGKTSDRSTVNNSELSKAPQRDNTAFLEPSIGYTTPVRKSEESRSMSADDTSLHILRNPTKGDFITRPSPATVSSGYESDFTPVYEADIDDILCNGNWKDSLSMLNYHKTSGMVERDVLNPDEQYSDVCRDNEDIGNSNVKKYSHAINDNNKDEKKVRKLNNQLTKLSRSMYEIIHDLQAADNSLIDNHRTGHKNRRQFPPKCLDMNTDMSPDNAHAAKDSIGSMPLKGEQARNNSECVLVRVGDAMVNTADNSVKCSNRNHTYSRLSGEDTSTLTDCSDNPPSRGYVDCEMNGHSDNSFTGVFRANVCFTRAERNSNTTNCNGLKPSRSDRPISVRERWWQKRCDRYISNVSYVSNIAWRDDTEHIYETIPGDEPQYAVINKGNLKMESTKKFHRVPDLPGTFVPLDPPKLPERKKICQADNIKSTDNYVDMSNTALYSTVKKPTKSAPESAMFICDSQTTAFSGNQSESDYCHFDPLLSVHNISENDLNRWNTSDLLNHIDGIQQPPAKRRENLYWLLDDKQLRAQFSESLEIENRLKDMGVFDSCYNTYKGITSLNHTGGSSRRTEVFGNCYNYNEHQSDLLNMSSTNRTGNENDVGLQYIQPTYV